MFGNGDLNHGVVCNLSGSVSSVLQQCQQCVVNSLAPLNHGGGPGGREGSRAGGAGQAGGAESRPQEA